MGAVIGVIADIISPQPHRAGILGATLLGVFGAILGGFASHQLINTSLFTFNLESFSFALTGSTLLLIFGRIFSTDISRFHKFER